MNRRIKARTRSDESRSDNTRPESLRTAFRQNREPRSQGVPFDRITTRIYARIFATISARFDDISTRTISFPPEYTNGGISDNLTGFSMPFDYIADYSRRNPATFPQDFTRQDRRRYYLRPNNRPFSFTESTSSSATNNIRTRERPTRREPNRNVRTYSDKTEPIYSEPRLSSEPEPRSERERLKRTRSGTNRTTFRPNEPERD